MQIGVIGLERMGADLVQRLTRQGHECVVFNGSPEKVRRLEEEGAIGTSSLTQFAQLLTKPRVVWLMLPAGAVEEMLLTLMETLGLGDIVVDGGNSYYKDDVRRAKLFNSRGMHYVDVGISGDRAGLEQGYCLMIGGDRQIVDYLTPIFHSLTAGTGEPSCLHCGAVGAGHFVKMVHTSVRGALMQAYAEGFEILHSAGAKTVAEYCYELDIPEIAAAWCRCHIVGSGLLECCARAFAADPNLSASADVALSTEEDTWAMITAIEAAVPAKVLSTALFTRFLLHQSHPLAGKLLTVMDSQAPV